MRKQLQASTERLSAGKALVLHDGLLIRMVIARETERGPHLMTEIL
jgi:hypothetical protein